jgi:protein-arginine kinase activator protein McsA
MSEKKETVMVMSCDHIKNGAKVEKIVPMKDEWYVALCEKCADPNETYINADAIWRKAIDSILIVMEFPPEGEKGTSITSSPFTKGESNEQ